MTSPSGPTRRPSWEGATYDGPLTLFWASDTGSTDATMGWGALVPAVDIRRVSMPHERMMDRDVVAEVADPFQIGRDADRADDLAQVVGHRLPLGDEHDLSLIHI